MAIKSIKNVKNLKGKTVLVRCDFDVPIKEIRNKKSEIRKIILDDSRLKAGIPTIEYLLKKQAKVVLMGHLGRPGGKADKNKSLLPVAEHLIKLLRARSAKKIDFIFVKKMERYLGREIENTVQGMKSGQIVMLENLRFSDREEAGCRRFAQKLAALGDIYVNEALAVSHHASASISVIQDYLPSYAGLHLIAEISHLQRVIKNPHKPLVVIIGGAKIETKLPVIKEFLGRADYILLGSALANNFYKAFGYKVGKSKVDDGYLEVVKKLYKKQETGNKKSEGLILPVDVKTSLSVKKPNELSEKEAILDIGPETMKTYQEIIRKARTIIWNGPMGKFEEKKYRHGTEAITRAVLKSKAHIVIGGGETAEMFKNKKLPKNIFVSVGGGAMLDYLAGEKLPGIVNLIK